MNLELRTWNLEKSTKSQIPSSKQIPNSNNQNLVFCVIPACRDLAEGAGVSAQVWVLVSLRFARSFTSPGGSFRMTWGGGRYNFFSSHPEPREESSRRRTGVYLSLGAKYLRFARFLPLPKGGLVAMASQNNLIDKV